MMVTESTKADKSIFLYKKEHLMGGAKFLTRKRQNITSLQSNRKTARHDATIAGTRSSVPFAVEVEDILATENVSAMSPVASLTSLDKLSSHLKVAM